MRHRNIVVSIFQSIQHRRTHLVGPGGNGEAELAQQPAHGVDRGGAFGLVMLAEAVQALRALLLRRLDRHRMDIAAACRFQQASGIGAIRLVAPDVGPNVLRGQQFHAVPESGKAPRPGMRRAAGFHHDAQRRTALQALRERRALEPLALDDAPRCIGKGQFEHVLGKIDGKHDGGRCGVDGFGGSVHGGLLS